MNKQTRDVFVVETLEQLKILSDGLRMRIVEAFSHEPRTTKQVAQLLGEKQLTKLYHHVEALERVGIVRLVKTKRNRGTVEKYFQTVARTFRVDHSLFAPRAKGEAAIAALHDIYSTLLETTIVEIRRSISEKLIQRQDDHSVLLTRFYLRASSKKISQLRQKFQKLLDEAAAVQEKEGDMKYALAIAFYPINKESEKGA
jgi:DNA-binding transcriptional ArsR family regulator